MNFWLLSSVLLFSCPMLVVSAQATQTEHYRVAPTYRPDASPVEHGGKRVAKWAATGHGVRIAGKQGVGISCVPYAREVSGIMVTGNAWQWWNNAQGLYARGDLPEIGSVLNFRPNGRMRLGHVAVVTKLVNAREVIVDHSNWAGAQGSGRVSRGIAVVDVSEANNWSAVRVELGRAGEFGSVYPTYGFIYNRADTGQVTTSVARPAPQPAINPIPSDLRPVAERPWRITEEVAQLPESGALRIDLSLTSTTKSR